MDWKEAAELTRKLKKNDSGDVAETLLGGVIVIAAFVLIGVPLAIYFIWSNAFAVQHMWQWFIVSTFDLRPLTMAQSWGIAIIIAYLTHVTFTWKAKDEREMHEKIAELVVTVLKPWVALGVAYICAHFFMKVV